MSNYRRQTLLFKNPVTSTSGFILNQNVTLSYSNNIITATCNQSTSTPGVRFGTFTIPKGEVYELVVKGRSIGGANAYLWGDLARDHSTRVTAITSDTTVYLPNATANSVSTVIGGFNTNTQVRVGVLFESPSVDDQLEIEAVALIKRDAVKLGEWTIYDMPSNLVINSKNTAGEWKFVGAFVKND